MASWPSDLRGTGFDDCIQLTGQLPLRPDATKLEIPRVQIAGNLRRSDSLIESSSRIRVF